MLKSAKIDYLEINCPYCEKVFDYVLWDEVNKNFISYTKSIPETSGIVLSTYGKAFHKVYSPGEYFICEKCDKPFNLREIGKIPKTLEQLEEDNMILEKKATFYLKSVHKLDKIEKFLEENPVLSRKKFKQLIKGKI